jgi:hypothetical protein
MVVQPKKCPNQAEKYIESALTEAATKYRTVKDNAHAS